MVQHTWVPSSQGSSSSELLPRTFPCQMEICTALSTAGFNNALYGEPMLKTTRASKHVLNVLQTKTHEGILNRQTNVMEAF